MFTWQPFKKASSTSYIAILYDLKKKVCFYVSVSRFSHLQIKSSDARDEMLFPPILGRFVSENMLNKILMGIP